MPITRDYSRASHAVIPLGISIFFGTSAPDRYRCWDGPSPSTTKTRALSSGGRGRGAHGNGTPTNGKSARDSTATSQPSDGQWDCNFIWGCRSVLREAGIGEVSNGYGLHPRRRGRRVG
jgi:hypothetical protein